MKVFGDGEGIGGGGYDPGERDRPDPVLPRAIARVREVVEERREEVFFSRQLEVWLEDEFFHWITNRAVRELVRQGFVLSEERRLEATGGPIGLIRHHSYRYYKRAANRLMDIVGRYSAPNIGAALGLQGEVLVLEGFAREQFLMLGRDVREHGGERWTSTEHNMDFAFERDGRAYGVEIKNKLGYMDRAELLTKVRLCGAIGLVPVFVARMLPKSWINEVRSEGGFCLILKYQLYPWAHKELADEVRGELGLPVDAPRRLEDGTMRRFVNWHEETL